MALKGKAAEDWKKKNYDKSIKVSDAIVKQLLKGTKTSNIAAANKPGASAQYKEAVRRFYGKNTVKSTVTPSGPSAGSPNTKEPRLPVTVTPNMREDRRSVPRTNTPGPGGRNVRAKGPSANSANVREGRSSAGMSKTSTSTSKTNTPKGTGNTKRVNKPLIDLPKMLGNSQAKLDKKKAATQKMLDEQRRAVQAKKDATKKKANQK